MAKFTRGFIGRGRAERDPRLPPGQYDARDDWPVLNAEVTTDRDTSTWTFTVDGLVERPTTWTWDEIHALPPSTYAGDIHCVTTWSKLGITFTGVSVDTLLAATGLLPTATHVLALAHTGYTTNLPLADVSGGKAWVTWEVDGRPLPRDHGGPARLLVPHLYFWKSAKWVSGLRLLDHDEPGFWEQNGYHDRGDPIAYTRQAPPGAERPPGRLSVADLAPAPRPDATVYVCGSARFADAASRLLVDAGVAVERIRVERFGPTG